MAVAAATNSSANANAKASASKKRTSKRQRGLFARLFSVIARLATWAALFTIAFRCPPTAEECTDDSPFICKHFFRVKGLVHPHIRPYYDQYAAPYVDAAQPYLNTVKVNVVDPAQHYAVHYGAPWAESGKQYVWAQWETNGQPRLAHVQAVTRQQYDKSVAPHVAHASRVLEPYYKLAQANAQVAFDKAMLPAYEFAKPYAIYGYDAGYAFTTTTVVPAVTWGWSKTNAFLDTAVWPQLRIVYVENVEPQLVRIGERLGRYKLRSRTRTHRETTTSSQYHTSSSQSSFISKPSPQSATAGSESIQATASTAGVHVSNDEAGLGRNPVEPPPQEENETDRQKRVREMVTQDLESWQDKFAQQAEDGAAAIEDSVDEIARGMINNNANVTGRALVDQLEKTITTEVDNLKSTILSIVADELEGRHTDDTDQEIVKAIRSTGVAIKGKAQLIRGWREDYDAELQDTVLSTADVHFQILEETRSLALQQIGMRWAWTDGITYKDWAKYHELKSTFSDWTEELKQLIVTHPTLLEAQEASARIEDDGMSVAAAAAQNLANLKEVAKWKILAEDSSDNFDLDALKLAIEERERAKQEAEEEAVRAAKEAEELKARADAEEEEASDPDSASGVDGNSQPVEPLQDDSIINDEETVAGSSETTESQAREYDDVSTEDSTGDGDAESAEGKTTEEVAKEQNDGTGSGSTAPGDDNIVAAAEEDTEPENTGAPVDEENAKADFGDRVVPNRKPQTRPTQPADSELHDYPTFPNDAASGSTAGDKKPGQEPNDPIEADQNKLCEPPGQGAKVMGALFGAFAQAVPERHPILDDEYEDEAEKNYYVRATAAAQDAYARAVAAAEERYSMASSVVSVQMYGTPKPVHKNLLSSLTAAYDHAVSAASSRLDDATSRAGKGLYAAPTPTTNSHDMLSKAEEIAARRLREGRVWAEMQYRSALIAMGLSSATATPTGIPDRVKYNYYAALGIAHDRYARFLSAASSAWSSVAATATPTPTDRAGKIAESASSLASAAGASLLSVANAAGHAAESAYSAATEGVMAVGDAVDEAASALFDTAQDQVLIAGKTLSDIWETVIEELQAEMYGEVLPIGWEEHMAHESTLDTKSTAAPTHTAIEKQSEAVAELVSELLGGKEAPFTESVFSRLSEVYASATKTAGSLASEASSAVASMGDRMINQEKHERDEL